MKAFLIGLLQVVAAALAGYLRQRSESEQNRKQVERLAREAEAARIELAAQKEAAREGELRNQVEESARNLNSSDALSKLRVRRKPAA